MGMIVDKAKITGLMGGITNAKSGKCFLAVLSKGPKIDKFCFEEPSLITGDAPFGAPVVIELVEIEQKFSDFNGSYSLCSAARITLAPVK